MKTNKERQKLIVDEFIEALERCNYNPGVLIIAMTNEKGHARIWNSFDEGQKFPMIALSRIIDKQIMDGIEGTPSVINLVVDRSVQ